MYELEIFKNEEFGEIRTVEQNGQIFLLQMMLRKYWDIKTQVTQQINIVEMQLWRGVAIR